MFRRTEGVGLTTFSFPHPPPTPLPLSLLSMGPTVGQKNFGLEPLLWGNEDGMRNNLVSVIQVGCEFPSSLGPGFMVLVPRVVPGDFPTVGVAGGTQMHEHRLGTTTVPIPSDPTPRHQTHTYHSGFGGTLFGCTTVSLGSARVSM